MKQNLKSKIWFMVALCTIAFPAFGATIKEDYKSATITYAEGNPTTSGLYDARDDYFIGTVPWHADLNPLHPTEITADVGGNFLTTLEAKFPKTTGWEFLVSASTLPEDSLIVHTYDVLGSPSPVGCEFHVEFKPPTPVISVHWIQVVTDNHNITNDPGHGHLENVVDILGSSPYYDERGAAISSGFYDFPTRPDGDASHYWVADLFLVTGPDPATVTPTTPGVVMIYSTGIRWGWTNVPEPGTVLLLSLGGLALLRRRRR